MAPFKAVYTNLTNDLRVTKACFMVLYIAVLSK